MNKEKYFKIHSESLKAYKIGEIISEAERKSNLFIEKSF